jgi:hypothetical protein
MTVTLIRTSKQNIELEISRRFPSSAPLSEAVFTSSIFPREAEPSERLRLSEFCLERPLVSRGHGVPNTGIPPDGRTGLAFRHTRDWPAVTAID